MKRVLAFLASLLVSGAVSAQSLADPSALAAVVVVEDVAANEAGVTGQIVNRSDATLKDVRLLVQSVWDWANEYQPGAISPGRATFHLLGGEIPPGGSAPFEIRFDPPLATRDEGAFRTRVEVVGVSEVRLPSVATE